MTSLLTGQVNGCAGEVPPNAPVAVPSGEEVSDAAAVSAATTLLEALGVRLDGEHRRGTPGRMVRTLREMLTAPEFAVTSFENVENYHELIVVEAIPFFSLCEHHLLPFVGTATVAYLPGERIVGLSKLARVVELFARRLQVQERMTIDIADWMVEHLQPQGVGVRLRAEHLCMSLRGARADRARTTTSARRGALADDSTRRDEWSQLLASSTD